MNVRTNHTSRQTYTNLKLSCRLAPLGSGKNSLNIQAKSIEIQFRFFCYLIFQRAHAIYKSKCPSVCVSVRVSVRLLTFEVPLKRLLPPLPEVGCPKNLQIWNPWGKEMERSGLRFEHFSLEVV